MNEPQVIVDETGRPTFAVIPWSDYERLAAIDEDIEDAALCDRARAGEMFPSEVADQIIDGETRFGCFETTVG